MWNWETMRSRMKQFAPKYLKHFSMEAEMASEASVKSDIKQRKEIVKTVTHWQEAMEKWQLSSTSPICLNSHQIY